ncbi:MAG: hypothetical protein GC200_06190 [Tepidisphaera sp.]|nr:hypothetical protein [Tepidisphaera sp.]
MDDRQQQIRERAGLEESRLNQEFIDWLRTWGTPILLVLALVAAAYALQQRWAKAKAEKIDDAFVQLDSASQGDNPSPDALAAVAHDFDNVKSVGLLARLQAADAYLGAVQKGLKLGATLKPNDKNQLDGTLENPDDALTPELKATYLTSAADLYQQVYDKASTDSAKALLTLNSLYGLAAVAESQEKFDVAKSMYEKIEQLTDKTPYAAHAAIAKERIAKLDTLKNLQPVLSLAELPKRPEPPAPPAPKAPAGLPPGATLTPVPGPPGAQPSPAAKPAEGTPAAAPATAPATTPPATPSSEPAKPAESPATPAPATPK